MKGYLVSSIFYNYNDEVNYRDESGAVTPNVMFLKEDNAISYVRERNILDFSNFNPTEYGYELCEVSSLTDEEVIKELESFIDFTKGVMDYETYNKPFTSEQAKILSEVFDLISFYEIRRIEIEGEINV